MRVKDILKINAQLSQFNVLPPTKPPQVELTSSPSLEQIHKAFRAFNIPYDVLTIPEMQGVIILMKKRFSHDDAYMQVLETLSNHLVEMEAWLRE